MVYICLLVHVFNVFFKYFKNWQYLKVQYEIVPVSR
jgi:hypothetical protein